MLGKKLKVKIQKTDSSALYPRYDDNYNDNDNDDEDLSINDLVELTKAPSLYNQENIGMKSLLKENKKSKAQSNSYSLDIPRSDNSNNKPLTINLKIDIINSGSPAESKDKRCYIDDSNPRCECDDCQCQHNCYQYRENKCENICSKIPDKCETCKADSIIKQTINSDKVKIDDIITPVDQNQNPSSYSHKLPKTENIIPDKISDLMPNSVSSKENIIPSKISEVIPNKLPDKVNSVEIPAIDNVPNNINVNIKNEVVPLPEQKFLASTVPAISDLNNSLARQEAELEPQKTTAFLEI